MGGDGRVRLEIDGAIATITNDNVAKKNAFDDEMDLALFEILATLRSRDDIRAVIWRAEGTSFSTGRDVGSIGVQTNMSHHALMKRGHRGILALFDMDAPVIVAMKGWSMGGSFQRALLCDIRVASEDARFRLPELTHGVIPDTGGMGRLYEICGPGLVSDMVLCGRTLDAQEALTHGIVSRVVPNSELDATVREMAEIVASRAPLAVGAARRIIRHLSEPTVRASMEDELVYQTFLNWSEDGSEIRKARSEGRPPHFKGR